MTLIAFATNGETADIITDSLIYTYGGSELRHGTKQLPLPHLDTVILTQGDSVFGDNFKGHILTMSRLAVDFDDLVNHVREEMRRVWQFARDNASAHGPSDSTAFLVGYSPARGAFAGYGFASETDFEPWLVDGLHVMPSPISYRPSRLELDRMATVLTARELQLLRNRPQPQAPLDEEEWAGLAMLAREQRACMPASTGIKVFVGGSVLHTHLERGYSETTVIHTFDDSGAELQRMVSGTHHPQGQLGSCECGSGARYLDCCLAEHLDEPCLCGSARPFRDCCMVGAQRHGAPTPDATTKDQASVRGVRLGVVGR